MSNVSRQVHMNALVITLLASALVGYTGWVTFLVLRSSALERNQKVLQAGIAWLIPLFGAVLVHLINRAQDRGLSPRWAPGAEPQIDQGVSPRDFESPGHG
jgi:hypothetical protein